MPKTLNLSVVVVVKNEEEHIEDALISIKSSKPMPSEIIVIDGDSNDRTVEIAKKYTSKVFVSKNSNLTDDRQIGINKASNNLIAMIDVGIGICIGTGDGKHMWFLMLMVMC